MKKAERLEEVKPSGIRAIFTIANKMRADGKRVIDFGLGDINIGLPEVVKNGIIEALDSGKTTYGPDVGEPALKEALVNRYNKNYRLNINSNNILVTCGAMESLLDTFLAYLSQSDEVIIHEPSFGNISHQIILAGGKPKVVLSDPKNEFKLTADMVNEAISPKTKILLINFPTNPTSMILDHSDLKSVVEVCADNNLLLVSDESYESLYYEGKKHVSALEFDYENTIMISSVSKSLCMTGLRLGFTIGHQNEIMKPIFQVHQYNTVHATRPIQYGAIKGFEHEERILKQNLHILNQRRKIVINHWSKIPGIKFYPPKAGFYTYLDISETGMNSDQFCKFALDQGICLVPGAAFGRTQAPGMTDYCRLSFGMSEENEIKEAANILTETLS
ncbi:MAG: pyridoxal phosphate-dependent aminotransferase [Candidatus Hodarchaeales archaeon]|jgi:aspartate aminotransferase